MKFKSKIQPGFLNKYDFLILLLVIAAVIVIVGIWTWYGYKSQELEKEIYMLK